jgi:hypothetical protein
VIVHRVARPLAWILLAVFLGVQLTGTPAHAATGPLTVTGSERLTDRLWELTISQRSSARP